MRGDVGAGVVGSPQAVSRFTNVDDVVVDQNARVVSGHFPGNYSGHKVTLVGSRARWCAGTGSPSGRGPKATKGVKVVVVDGWC